MQYCELLEDFQTIDQVIEAYKIENHKEIKQGCNRDSCGIPAYGFALFARENGFPATEYVSTGSFKVDIVLYDKEDFLDTELQQMKKEGLDPDTFEDRVVFARRYDMVEDLKQIPHQWSEYKDRIIDFTAQSQFVDSGLAADMDQSRYSYKNKRELMETSRSAPLYHFTSFISDTLETNTLGIKFTYDRPNRKGKAGEVSVSLTRNPYHMFKVRTYCLILDQAKLAQKYKFTKTIGDTPHKQDREAEELITRSITPLSKYMKAIVIAVEDMDMDSSFFSDKSYIFQWAKTHNVLVYTARSEGYGFVNGWLHTMKLVDLDNALQYKNFPF